MPLSHFESQYPIATRFDELAKVAQYLKEGSSCQIVGMPGVGRSTILGFLAYNRAIREKHFGESAKTFHFVLVNFAEVHNKPLIEVTKLLFLELAASLQERNMQAYEEIQTMFKEALSFQDELVLFQGLKKAVAYLALEKGLTIVFLFERFEAYITMLTADFFTNLRIIRNLVKYQFSVIFSLTRPLEELIEPTLLADFYEFLASHNIYLPLFDKPGFDFRLKHFEEVSGKTIDSELVEKILSLTAGHGKLTKVCIEKCLQENVPTDKVTQEFLLSHLTIQGVLLEIWSFLSPDEQQAIITHERLQFLETIGLTKEGKITIPLFATYVEEQLQKEITIPIVWNETSNTITRGPQTLSDYLTGGEFRLLRLLLINQNRVVEREEIIAAVWQNSATTAGVSEQAIDQLVFRLRKKIEPDPTHPTLLQTIKGRGLKLEQ